MPLLEINGVSKSYVSGVPAVDDVRLELAAGEIICLLGPSGCGKTTLLRIVAGLELPDRGSVFFEGRELAGIPPHERGFGMMFQDFALFPHKNVFDNVAFGLRMKGFTASTSAARVTEMLELVDLAGFEEREIDRLSGGEQQRVALARALAPGPQLLMLDEPLGALDRALRERLMIDVRDILKRVGVTALYVTHDQTESFAIGDRIAVMNAGRIEQVGGPQLVYERPSTPFVARFLGFENLLPAQVAESGIIDTPIGRFYMDHPIETGEATLLIRPSAEPSGSSGDQAGTLDNRVDGIVSNLVFRGRYSQLWLEVGDQTLLFEVTDPSAYSPGQRVSLPLASGQLQLLSGADEGNIRSSSAAE